MKTGPPAIRRRARVRAPEQKLFQYQLDLFSEGKPRRVNDVGGSRVRPAVFISDKMTLFGKAIGIIFGNL